MRATFGGASTIIHQARELGILCRPAGPDWRGSGMAIQPDKDADGFYYIDAGGVLGAMPHVVKPSEIIQDWELTTLDIIKAEYESLCKEPF